MTYNSPTLVVFFILVTYQVCKYLFNKVRKLSRKSVSNSKKTKTTLNEQLAPYFVALDDNDHACVVA